jgi:formate C-acetyltransferase
METKTAQSWAEILREGVERVRVAKRRQTLLEDWFLVQEIRMEEREAMRREGLEPDGALGQARLLCRVAQRMPLRIEAGAALAGSQDCAFSPSYALINPSFKVEEFAGYCDPTAVYNDIAPREEVGLTEQRIARVREYWADTDYVRDLYAVYEATGDETREVVYFVEPVTGHTIPDLREHLRMGVGWAQKQARALETDYGEAMATALEAVVILADRYRDLARRLALETEDENERRRLETMAAVLEIVPRRGAGNLQEAVQSFVLLWQTMVLEQAPNPYAFSVGNLDRVLAPYYERGGGTREEAVELVRHLLCFYQVGNRCWAISQNVIAGGRDSAGHDLTSEMTEVVLDAFFLTNDPQPALSVKVHAGTPESLYRSLGRFFFTPGHSTPSLFNDDMMFEVLRDAGVSEEDLPDYAIAGCQEPLIMGKSSLNTTNTWLNLAKIIELTLTTVARPLRENNWGRLGKNWGIVGVRRFMPILKMLSSACSK